MSRKILLPLLIGAIVIIVVAGLIGTSVYINDLPNRISQHETIVLGQNRLVPGSQAGLRVVVRDSKDTTPLENAAITAYLQPADGGKAIEVFSGTTDEYGSTDINFQVPEDAAAIQTLIVKTESSLGSDEIQRPITITRDYRILLTTDKPIYQPGQIIHMLSLIHI